MKATHFGVDPAKFMPGVETVSTEVQFTKAKPKTKKAILSIEGYASTVDRDADGDIILPTAYAETLDFYLQRGITLFMHDWYSKPIGKAIDGYIDGRGLYLKADILDTVEGRDIATLIEAGVLDSFSVGFGNVTRDTEDESIITKLKLYENSVVNLGSNPTALFEVAKELEIKSFNLTDPQGSTTINRRSSMPAPFEITKEMFDDIKKMEKIVGQNQDSLETVKTEMQDLQKNITDQAKLLKLVEDAQSDLKKGFITKDEFITKAEKIATDIETLQEKIKKGKQGNIVSQERMLVQDWRSMAKGINFIFDNNGTPLPANHQKAFHIFQRPVDYSTEEGRFLKNLRDLHDTIVISDAYFTQQSKHRHLITNLKTWQLFHDLLDKYDPEFAKAMYATGSGVGDEWVPTEMSSQLYEAYELGIVLESYIPSWDMPSNPATYPIKTGHASLYRAAEATSDPETTNLTGSNISTGNVTFTAETFAAAIRVSPQLVEDAIISIVPEIRSELARTMGDGYESLLINGDTGTHGDTQASYTSANPETYEKGFRYQAIDASAQYDASAGFTAASVREARALLPGAHAHKAGNLVYVCNIKTWIAMLSFAEYTQVGTYGANASWKTGDLPSFDGSPLVLTSHLRNDYHTDGTYSVAATTNLHSQILVFDKTAFKIGQKRGTTIEYEKNINTQQLSFVGSMRKSFKSMESTPAVAMTHNFEL